MVAVGFKIGFHDCLVANIQAIRTNAPKRDCVAERTRTAK